MGDIMKDKTDFSALAKSYQNFFIPAMKIKVGTKDIMKDLKVGVMNLNVTLTLDGPSSASFTIVNAYELSNNAFSSQVIKAMKVGEKLSVELGYGSKLTEVFSGYLHNRSYQFNGSPTISVTALDIRALMRENSRTFTYTGKKHSQIVKEIMTMYQKYVTAETDPDEETEPPEYLQDTSDMNFMEKTLCKRANREFFIIGGKAYFKKRHKISDKEITTLSWGTGLLSFSSRVSYCNKKLKIIGHDVKTNKPLVSQRDAISDKSAIKAASNVVWEIADSDADTKMTADNILEYEMDKLMKKTQTGSGSCIGLPEIIPGRYIRIDKMDTYSNGKYYILQVTHSFGEDGFTTDFELGGKG